MTAAQQSTYVVDPFSHDGMDLESVRCSALAALLLHEIVLSVGHRVQDLCVIPTNGTLLVQGRVHTYYLKQLVITAAMRFHMNEDTRLVLELEVIS